jgi:hypothetical protein
MKHLKLTALERVLLTQCLPSQAHLDKIPMYVRVIETLRLKEDEQAQVGMVESGDTVTMQDTEMEFDVALEDADFEALMEHARAWDRWPTVPQTVTLAEKLNNAAR